MALAVGAGVGITLFVFIVFAVGFWYIRRWRSRQIVETVSWRENESMRTCSRSEYGGGAVSHTSWFRE
jgi:hypothetical protein